MADTLDLSPRLAGFVAPAMQELQQRLLVGIELLERLAFDDYMGRSIGSR